MVADRLGLRALRGGGEREKSIFVLVLVFFCFIVFIFQIGLGSVFALGGHDIKPGGLFFPWAGDHRLALDGLHGTSLFSADLLRGQSGQAWAKAYEI